MKKMSFLRMLVFSLIGFALTFSSNIQDPPLMTFKTRQLAPNLPNTVMGILGFVGLLVAMAVQPIVGVFSDRAKTKLGRRLPFLIGGVLLISLSLFLLVAAPTLWVLLLGVIAIQFSSNILQGPWQALIPDLVPEAQHGQASSLKGVMDIIALVVGGLVAGKILSTGIARWGNNGVYFAAAVPTVVFIVFLIFTLIWGRERHNEGLSQPLPTRSVGEALKNAFNANFRENRVFGWWFANRILFWGAFIAINTFLINYLVDVIRMTQADAQAFYGNLKLILGGALILLALLSGWLSDRIGRKPILLASGFVSFAGALFLLFVHDQALITVAGAIIGMGIGAFITVSWALATDIVPKAEAARYLGIANIATCIGSGLARLLGGVLIDPINKLLGSSSMGYQSLFILATLCFLASALVIVPLPNKRVQREE